MSRLERLYFPCCDRNQDTREAVFRYCPNSYLVDTKDAYRGQRKPCKDFKRPRYGGSIVTADFCCSEKCCARKLRARSVEVGILEKKVKTAGSWMRRIVSPVECLLGVRRYKTNILARKKQIAEYQLKQGCENCSRLRAEWCDGRVDGLGREAVEEKEVTEADENGVQVPRAESLVRIGKGKRPHAYWSCPCDSCEVARARDYTIVETPDDELEVA